MKIKYDMTENYSKYYNEAQGCFQYKTKLKDNKNFKVRTYTSGFNLKFLPIICLLVVMEIMLSLLGADFYKNLYIGVTIYVLVFYIVVMLTYFSTLKLLKGSKKGEIIIDKEGITDSSNGVVIQLKYEAIDMVVVTKNTITVIPKKQTVIIFAPNDKKDKIISAIQKNSKVLVIDKSI